MSRVVISAKDLPAELQRREAAIRRAIGRGIRDGARRGRAFLVRKTPKDQGQAKAAWRDTATGRTSGMVAEVMNDAPYIGILEAGARPHPVSEEGQRAIFEWVKRNIANFIGRDRARTIKRRFKSYLDIEAKQIASAIVWKIRKYGQAPTYFIRDSLPELTDFAADEVAREMRALAKRGRAD